MFYIIEYFIQPVIRCKGTSLLKNYALGHTNIGCEHPPRIVGSKLIDSRYFCHNRKVQIPLVEELAEILVHKQRTICGIRVLWIVFHILIHNGHVCFYKHHLPLA